MIRAFVALGSNLGNRSRHIFKAFCELRQLQDTIVTDTSLLYENKAKYVSSQPDFLNAVCEIRTKLSPADLLIELKLLEEKIGRKTTADSVRNGPREIDLDIVLYDDDKVINESNITHNDVVYELQVPHKRMIERDFVLRPLCDMVPDLVHPIENQSYSDLLDKLVSDGAIHPVLPVQVNVPDRAMVIDPIAGGTSVVDNTKEAEYQEVLLKWNQGNCYIMGIINLTPDSFSDGAMFLKDREAKKVSLDEIKREYSNELMFDYETDGEEKNNIDLDQVSHHAAEYVKEGCNIVDVGGESTRPGAEIVEAAVEIGRILPAIRHLRSKAEFDCTVISVDTSKAEVALEAIKAGANMINDVSGGRNDNDMFNVISSTGVPIILMHSRGNPRNMNQLTEYSQGVIHGIKTELQVSINEAIKAGVPRWLLVSDPGIGFAKTHNQNLQTLKHLKQFTSPIGAPPVLVGASRKGFLGKITGRIEATERDPATSVVNCIAVMNGASFLRVHNVGMTRDVIAVTTAVQQVDDA